MKCNDHQAKQAESEYSISIHSLQYRKVIIWVAESNRTEPAAVYKGISQLQFLVV